MMEKSGEVQLTEYEKSQIKGEVLLEKQAGDHDPRIPSRFVGRYTLEELKEYV